MARAETLGRGDVQITYRAAAVHALAGRRDPELEALAHAARADYDRRAISKDEDFEGLRKDPRCQAVVGITQQGARP